MKKLITIFAVVLMTIIPFVFAQSIFTTTTDNSNDAGTFGSPDGDMDTSICYDHPSQPVEFYINQNINISAIENASLRLAVRKCNNQWKFFGNLHDTSWQSWSVYRSKF